MYKSMTARTRTLTVRMIKIWRQEWEGSAKPIRALEQSFIRRKILTVVDYGPTGGTEVGELLEAGKAADETAGAPGAKEEAADGEEPTLGLYIILDPGHHLGRWWGELKLGDESLTVWQPHLSVTSSAGHLHPLTPELRSCCGSHLSQLQQTVPRPGARKARRWRVTHCLVVGGGRDLTFLLSHPAAPDRLLTGQSAERESLLCKQLTEKFQFLLCQQRQYSVLTHENTCSAIVNNLTLPKRYAWRLAIHKK